MTLPGSSVLDARGQVCSLQVKDQLDLSLLLQPQEGEERLEVVVGFFDLADHTDDLDKRIFTFEMQNNTSHVAFTCKVCHFDMKS